MGRLKNGFFMANEQKDRSDWQFMLDTLVANGSKCKGFLSFPKLSHIEKIQRCYNDEIVNFSLQEYIGDCCDNCVFNKSADISKQYRTKGNEAFTSARPLGALDLYTKAVLYAPAGSEELALAFGNRSAVLHLKGCFHECIADIDRAMELDSADDARTVKLLIRKGKAYIGCKNHADATISLKKAKKILDQTGSLPDDKSKQLKQEVETLLKADVHGEYEDPNAKASHNFVRDKKSFESNPEFMNASEKIKLSSTQEKGRHVLAKKDVSIGDVLFVEEPFAFVVLPDKTHSHCHNCAVKIQNPLPCDHCAEGTYCSETCKNNAWKNYHHLECGVGLDLCYNIGIAHLGLRVALVGLTNEDSVKYKLVKELVHHLDAMKPEDIYTYSLTATLLVLYLEHQTNLFRNQKNRKGKLLELGSVILVHIAQLICNGHAIVDCCQIADSKSQVVVEEQKRIGTGIYPSTSMMNHSCDPNINASFFKSTIVVKAMKNIGKGNEVFNCYGPNFRRMKTEERKENLKYQYSFDCNCEPCTTRSEFLDKFTNLICSCCGSVLHSEVLQCVSCKKKFPSLNKKLEEAAKLFSTGKMLIRHKDNAQALQSFTGALDIKRLFYYKYSKEVMECKDQIAKLHAALGNYYESFLIVEDCLTGVQERYGETSIEYANEVVKLTDIMDQILKKVANMHENNRILLRKCLTHCKIGAMIFKLFYGTFNEKYNYITNKIKHFESFNE